MSKSKKKKSGCGNCGDGCGQGGSCNGACGGNCDECKCKEKENKSSSDKSGKCGTCGHKPCRCSKMRTCWICKRCGARHFSRPTSCVNCGRKDFEEKKDLSAD